MIENLKKNTHDQKEQALVATTAEDADATEYLGRYYKLIDAESSSL